MKYINGKKVSLFAEKLGAQVSGPSHLLMFLFATSFSLIIPAFCHSEQTVRNDDGWKDLEAFIGSYDIQAVLGDERVKRALEGLDAEDLATILDRIEVAGPIGFDGDCLMIRGNMVRKGDSDLGQFFVCTLTEEIHAATISETVVLIFTNHLSYDHLPYDFRLWIDANRLRLDLPQATENRLTAFSTP